MKKNVKSEWMWSAALFFLPCYRIAPLMNQKYNTIHRPANHLNADFIISKAAKKLQNPLPWRVTAPFTYHCQCK
jgi:hypothetical protein